MTLARPLHLANSALHGAFASHTRGRKASKASGMGPCLKLAGQKASKRWHGLSREEAHWFLSLPSKVQRLYFSKEEQISLKAASEIALIDILDETYWSYGNIARAGGVPSLCRRSTDDDSTNEGWDEELVSCDTLSTTSSLRLPVYRLRSLEPLHRRGSIYSPRHSQSGSLLASKNFSHPFYCIPEAEQDDQKVSTWLSDGAPCASNAPPQENKCQTYQDPHTRKKLRRFLSTDHAFDEALNFGFPASDTKDAAEPNISQYRPYSSSFAASVDARPTRPQAGRVGSAEPSSPIAFDDGETPMPLSSNPPHRLPRRVIHSSSSSRPSERDMTIRMTLTRPELRSSDEEMYAWQQQQEQEEERAGAEAPVSDPWALEQLPASDDVTGRHGAFAGAEKDFQRLRKVWRVLGRR